LKRLAIGADEATMTALADLVSRHPADAATTLLALPEQTQRTLLEYQWPALDRAWIRPVLERLYTEATPARGGTNVADLALRRRNQVRPRRSRTR
jgi:hypothetical protein